jgi:predicted ATPase
LSFRLGMTQTTDRPPQTASQRKVESTGFTEIGVGGFKSFAEETRIQLGSLTILAGANSSGKSSIMQPLLLMKQTLEAPYDPGALLLDGANVQFSSGEQLIWKEGDRQSFTIRFSTAKSSSFSQFDWHPNTGIDLVEQTWFEEREDIGTTTCLKLGVSEDERIQFFVGSPSSNPANPLTPVDQHQFADFTVERDRCFLKIVTLKDSAIRPGHTLFTMLLRNLIHVKGLRGSPERTYKTAAVSGSTFVGQFENYVANIIDRFQKEDPEKLIKLQQALQKLGLTDIIQAQRLNDTQIELRVGRVLGQADPTDTVNIADVGFGVSQVLPVIVALLVAEPEQMVYIEQPEIHLHPRAQVALSEIFADAANRGVRVVVETHSELFLMGIQALVAEDKLAPNAVKLHWFSRQSDGSSKVTSADLDETGAFGDWPEDFGSIALDMANRYLRAAEAKLWNSHSGNSSHG